MKVILIDEIRGLGSRCDIVTVKDGYARNYLMPKNLAREATPGNLKAVEQEKKKWALLAQAEKTVAQKAADSVQGMKIVVQKRTGENGQLFGSVTANEIADALLAKGVQVEKRRIELTHPIKTLGVHEVDVRLHREVTAHVQVEVVPIGVEKLEEQPAPAATAEQPQA
ncbi:MAG: 50S ribosomal protein L9 [Thermoanaerobaculia bacterium]